MYNKGIVKVFPNCNLEVNFSEHFIYGRQNLIRFPSRDIREKWIMEFIHSDVFGLILC